MVDVVGPKPVRERCTCGRCGRVLEYGASEVRTKPDINSGQAAQQLRFVVCHCGDHVVVAKVASYNPNFAPRVEKVAPAAQDAGCHGGDL